VSTPLQQFEIKSLVPGTFDFAGFQIHYFTNSSLFMVLALIAITLFIHVGTRGRKLVPSQMQAANEMLYEFISGMVRDNAGHEAKPYFPFVFSVFAFVLFGNLLGMIPYGFTFTSHIIVTFVLSFLVFLVVTLIGFAKHGFRFLTLFVPHGVPILLVPIIIPIEMISYLSRPVSLSIRLFANMMAGHTMMKVFAGFVVSLGFFGFVPLFVDVVLVGFELLIAFLQAYVFALLTCLYLHDSIHLH
jgi:F-type H+-transporting ATPase subunit a